MSVLNDDGLPLDLHAVFILFAMPNIIFVALTALIGHLICLSKKHPHLKDVLGNLANCFAKGALDRVIRNILRRFDTRNDQRKNHLLPLNSLDTKRKRLPFHFNFEKRYNANYLLLVPFQLDLLLTVFAYKILTRDVYQETCQSYLKTFHTRPKQVVCWLKNTNLNVSNLSINVSLEHYCLNQTITYINYEHNDVVCVHYVFKLINIVDTVTNIFAWHQAVVFIVTKSIVFCYWYQHKLRKTSFCVHLLDCQRHTMLYLSIFSISTIYILVFIFIIPIWFLLFERRRVDLTRHLLYACSKFIIAVMLHVNLYVLYQWHSFNSQKQIVLETERIQPIHNHKKPLLKSVASIDGDLFVSA